MKKLLALLLVVAMAATMLTGCGKEKYDGYFLNFKPESDAQWKEFVKIYKKETGKNIKVVTAASGQYEQTLTAEMAKKDAPTIFQINGPVGYQSWKDYCADLKDTKLYEWSSDKSLAVTSGDGVYGIPYAVEGYGIIVNNAIMTKYFALANKATTVASLDDINNFATLKAVVEDMQANKDALGIKGVFASTSMQPGNQWRWQTHLLNMPLFYEFKDVAGDGNTITAGVAAKEITFKYGKEFKNIWDLYLNNSCTEPNKVAAKTVDNAMAEFALGEVAMVQNGNWAWGGQINGTAGKVVKEEDIKYIPIYTGMAGEEKQGLCVGTENYYAINAKASEKEQKAAIEFLEWVFSSEKGKDYVVNTLGFMAPFTTFADDEKPTDPLAKEVLRWMAKDGYSSVPWTFAAFPSEAYKDTVGVKLLEYAQGQCDWAAVEKTVVDTWKSEKQ